MLTGMSSCAIEIHRYVDLLRPSSPFSGERLQDGLDTIFFQSSNTKAFASSQARHLFRERWLGRYLVHDPHWAYVASQAGNDIAGYLVGSIVDPAGEQRFADIAYFAHFADLTARFPAHLHVNLGVPFRNVGLGSALVQRFCVDAAAAGARGVHVVTSRGSRNVGFYGRNGFVEVGAWGEGGKEIVFLARDLRTP